MIALPPLEAGAVNAIVACPLPGVPVPIVGAPGTVAAIVIEKLCVAVPTALAAVTTPVKVPAAFGVPDAALAPTELFALTVQEYAVPLVRPETVSGLAAPLAASAPGLHVAV